MILVECEQGSEDWHRARAGVITASMFKVARERHKSGPKQGQFTEKALNYAFRVAAERWAGEPLGEDFVVETWQMRRGHALEPEARNEHQVQAGIIVQRAGFVLSDDRWFGASADGLIGHDGGSEYKCLVSPEAMRDVLLNGDLSEFMDQVQGCMWLTNRKWWHFGLYCPALRPINRHFFWREIPRNDAYIEALQKDLIEFYRLVLKFRHQLENVEPNQSLLQAA